MRKFISVLLILSVLVFFLGSREITPNGNGLNFDIEFTKEGILRYGFGTGENTPGDPYITFDSPDSSGSTASGTVTVPTLNFYYLNTFEGNNTLSVIFDWDDIYDYNPSDSGYMLIHEDGTVGLNYNVTISGKREDGTSISVEGISVSDSGVELPVEKRTVNITESGTYTIDMTLNTPQNQDYYTPGRYTGFVLLVYKPRL